MSKSALSHIEQTVSETVKSNFTSSTPSFVIAVSGGVDSMGLLYTFYRLDISALVAHVNYQKRGKASDKDAQLVAKASQQWGFEYEIFEADPEEAQGQNFQQWARDVRYHFFRDLVAQHDADGIALAHHKDDQVETILQKLFRGAGMSSWSGMDVWDGELFRPLLPISRQQIEQYASQHEIPFRTDQSNLETHFARNFLRNEWTVKLSEFFPGWEENILRMGEEAENYHSALQCITQQITDQQTINKQAFDELEFGLQRALILHLLKEYEPGIYVTQQNLKRVKELPDLQTGKKIQITADYSIVRDREYYILRENENSSLEAQELYREELKASPISIGEIEFSVERYKNPAFEKVLYLDADKISWPVTVRPWNSGDRFQPLGMSGHQTVADHLTNRKVSAAYKDEVLVIESFEETICALIFPPIKNKSSSGTISELVKCDENTKYCLRIKYLA
ncbi:tRNA lysidine(34) synthetase TilS [Fodinibius sp. Rm-B-1B1-1]|uniref:tRNA lysidine(34) synthetase TilS n=1 Tax=Fodinibius alkaliphilus TaxID=3140241 RepID=UPI003159CF35